MRAALRDRRVSVLYLAPWVDFGGTDKGTIDWFRWLDRDRFRPSLITTQPSENRRVAEMLPYADEVWTLPDLMAGKDMPGFILDFIHTRDIAVVQIMNSRLGFDLLPDLASLPNPPKVVVQLHVEEAERDGYVRYVTTRYGNLVDAFSVTSDDLAERVHGYDIPRDRIRTIYTGVDAEEEFSPDRVRPIEGLDPDRLHILFPGRIVEQKDPLLMAEVAAALREHTPPFEVHVVGDGALEPELHRRMAELGLNGEVSVHPPTSRLERWYAACDVLLMTSLFEGVPYVIYEAMAMEVPVVAPALPGNVELLRAGGGRLVEPRDNVDGYVDALRPLLTEPARRGEEGRRGRERVLERFSLRRMADEHAELFERLIAESQGPGVSGYHAAPRPRRLRGRSLYETPLVSIIIPCFNHGRWLLECLDSIGAQTHAPVETIVVDDASSDPETKAILDGLEEQGGLTILRLAENGGPSRARNRALEVCSGRYVLPVDADNILYPQAVERLVEQLKCAGEGVGFIYPNVQYFGNREDYFEAPDWDLYGLLLENTCDVCSLFDREVFEDGMRFDESIRLGHEDWELILRLAAQGVRGEPARAPTVRYRKQGFNRSDSVEHGRTAFHEGLGDQTGLSPMAAEIKARFSPELSLLALEPIDAQSEAGRRLAQRLAGQSCIDMELVARYDGALPTPLPEPPAIRIPPALADSPGAALADAWGRASGRLLAVTSGTGSDLLADPALVEKVIRMFEVNERGDRPLGALVLTDTGDGALAAMRLVEDGADAVRGAHTVVLAPETEERLAASPLFVDRDNPIESLLRSIVPATTRVIQWRHLRAAAPRRGEPSAAGGEVRIVPRTVAIVREESRARNARRRAPLLPLMPEPGVRRWNSVGRWTPPQSMVIVRHRQRFGERRVVTLNPTPPPGYQVEHFVGFVRLFSLQGTVNLRAIDGGDDFVTLPLGEWEGDTPVSRDLGYCETAPFPLLEPLVLARHSVSGRHVLISGAHDPLTPGVEPIETLGYVEPVVPQPALPRANARTFGLTGLTRAVDQGARIHRYAVGARAEGEFVGELGALLEAAPPGGTPLWIVDGRAVTTEHGAGTPPASVAAALRWTLAPLRWRGFAGTASRLSTMAKRAAQATASLASRRRHAPVTPEGEPAGWMENEALEGTVGLWAAYHPVTGDQLLSNSVTELTDMGYREPTLLGHLRAAAPITGSRSQHVVAVPWASRFGLEARRS